MHGPLPLRSIVTSSFPPLLDFFFFGALIARQAKASHPDAGDNEAIDPVPFPHSQLYYD